MSYHVIVELAAQRALRRLPHDVQRRLLIRLDQLAEDPRSPGTRRLAGVEQQLYRVRVGDYRIIYEIRDLQALVSVVTLGHRRDVYRRQ